MVRSYVPKVDLDCILCIEKIIYIHGLCKCNDIHVKVEDSHTFSPGARHAVLAVTQARLIDERSSTSIVEYEAA